MAYQGYPFPYDLANLLGGATRVVWAPISVALPAQPKDIFKQVVGSTAPPYALKTGWKEFGANRDAFAYNRAIEVGAYTIQNVSGNILEEPTNTVRTARVSIAEINPETLKIIEEGTDAAAVTASAAAAVETAKTSAYSGVAFGAIPELTQYRIAFISRRAKQAGIVTEGAAGPTRGRFMVGVGYRCQLTADNVELQEAKGELSAATVTFHFFPDPDASVSAGSEFGIWWDEQAGTIPA